MSRKSFIVYLDLLDSLDELSDAQAGKLFKTIKAYHRSIAAGATQECVANFEGLLKDFVNRLAFAPFRAAFERDAEKYHDKCRRYSENGKKGGRPRKEENDGLSHKPELTTAFSKKQSVFEKAKKADNVNDNDNVNAEDKSSSSPSPPDVVEVEEKLRKEVESYKLKPIWRSNIVKKFNIPNEKIDTYLDEFRLDMSCSETEVRKVSSLFIVWLQKKLTDETNKNNTTAYRSGIRSKLPPAAGHGLR